MASSDLAHLHVERRDGGPSAPRAVLTHGGGDTSATWDAQVAELTGQGWSTTTWDLRGHGRSAAPDDEDHYSRDLAIDDLAALVGDTPAVLVGHSLGGYLSLGLTLRRPEVVRALVLASTGPGFRDPEARDGWNRRVRRAVAGFDVPAAAAGLLRQEDAWVMDHLGDITVPTLLVVGEHDTAFLGAHELLARRLGGPTRAVVVPGSGHHAHRRRSDQVNAAITAFLDDVLHDRD